MLSLCLQVTPPRGLAFLPRGQQCAATAMCSHRWQLAVCTAQQSSCILGHLCRLQWGNKWALQTSHQNLTTEAEWDAMVEQVRLCCRWLLTDVVYG